MRKDSLYGNIWIFEIKLKKDETSPKHAHEFDHIHQVVRGSALMKLWDKDKNLLVEQEVKAGGYFKVPALYYHQICALEDYQGNCIHAFRNEDGNVLDSQFDINNCLYQPSGDIRDIK